MNQANNAYSETLFIIKCLPEKEQNKISKNFIEFLENNKNNNYIVKINPNIGLENQELLQETKELLKEIYLSYFVSKEEKMRILKKEEYKKVIQENLKKEEFSPDKILNKVEKKDDIKEEMTNNNTNKELIEYKETFFMRFKKFILKLLFIKDKKDQKTENKIEMIVFDLDGTLWETIDLSYEVTKKVVEKYDFLQEISKEIIIKTMGVTVAETAEMYMPYLEKEKREEILKEILDLTAVRLTEVGGNLYEGIEKTLIKLKKKYKFAIVSNCDAGYIESFLDSANLRKYFVDFAAAGKMKVTKAEAIKVVLERNNIKNAVYVGDTRKDLEASQTLGMKFIQAKYGFGEDLKTEYSINEVKELPNVLNDIVISDLND